MLSKGEEDKVNLSNIMSILDFQSRSLYQQVK
jgi:hypothetical protein